MENEVFIEVKDLTKSYSGVVVLHQANVQFRKGEVHALLGENGAGKSTLIKLITGAIKPDSGEIIVDGESYESMTPSLSKSLKIEAVYQELNLISKLSVAENIYLGNAIRNGIVIDRKEMARKTVELFDRFHIEIDPNTLVRNLTVAYMQLVEIAKAVSRNMQCLILDEPTAPLSDNETTVLFELVRQLKKEGVLIIFISHRLEELFEISDRVTIMRDGRVIETLNTPEVTRDQLISLMVGHEMSETYPERNYQGGEVVLEARNLYGNGNKNISFQLHKGEILGISGLVGSGRTELVRLLFGAEKPDKGEILLNGKAVAINNPAQAIRNGISLITEDRKAQGLDLRTSVKRNISLPILKRISNLMVLDRKKEESTAKEYIDSLSIKVTGSDQNVANLSGGNQQKVVLAKWLATKGDILIFDEPTRGIDVGAKQEIYHILNDLTKEGKSIIVVSSDMPELLGISDRILVFCENEISGELQKEEFSQERVLNLAMRN